MNDVVRFPSRVNSKQDSGRVGQHRYVLTYQPDAQLAARRWVWRVYYMIELQYHGYAPTQDAARRMAQQRIEELTNDHGS